MLACSLACSFSTVLAAPAYAETALPQISTALPGETYPIIGEGSVQVEVEGDDVFATSTTKIPDEETRVKLEVTTLGPSGVGEVELLGIYENKHPENRCNTAGDGEGIVLVKGEFHLVYTTIQPTGLEIGTLLTFTPFEVFCGVTINTVEGPLLGRVKPETEASGDSTTLKLAFHCSNIANGTQELSSYYSSGGTLITGQLLKANISGLGLENGCKELKQEATGKLTSSSAAKMFTILY